MSRFTISFPPFPEGMEVNVDEFLQWMAENGEIQFDGAELTGQVGGTRPTENVGLYVNGLDIELWDSDNSEYRVVSSVPVGGLVMWASASAVIPAHYLLCDGRTVLRDDYPKLFTAIGTTHNRGGEDSSVFRLPDLRGRFPMGSGQGEYRGGSNLPETGKMPLRNVGDYPGKSWPSNTPPWPEGPATGANRFSGGQDTLKPAGSNNIGDVTNPACVVQYLIRFE